MLLEMKQITKKFGTFTANNKIDFSLEKGEIHAIVGENGAGKTTLMKMLYGMEKPTSGKIIFNNEEKNFNSASEAIKSGIGMVSQHFMLFPSFTVAENIVIGNEPTNFTFNKELAYKEVDSLCEKYKIFIDPRKVISQCTVGMQQKIEILKVLYQNTDIIIMDEPTAVLTPIGVKELLAIIKNLAKEGKSIIIITHKLQEVMEIADRITVIRNGEVKGVLNKNETSIEELSTLMVGREILSSEKEVFKPGVNILSIKNLYLKGVNEKPILNKINFNIRKGEILGVAGVSGNGQSELIKAITGLIKVDDGEINFKGENIINKSVKEIRERGVAHVPEDRYLHGAAGEANLIDNMLMGYFYLNKNAEKYGILNMKENHKIIEKKLKEYSVKTSSLDNNVSSLSGGNMQKLIIAREMGHNPDFLIAAEPTRGVDIGAIEFIHSELLRKRSEGGAILLVSSELSEIMTLSDRIIVMYEGNLLGDIPIEEATKEKVGLLMAGGEKKNENI